MLDWVAANARVISIAVSLTVAALAALWMPALAAFAVGLGAGGVAVHVRMSARMARLRAETDELLRENGALRHEKTVIAKAFTASAESRNVITQKLPSIPEKDDG